MSDPYGGSVDPRHLAAIRRRSTAAGCALGVVAVLVGWIVGVLLADGGIDPVNVVVLLVGATCGFLLRARSEGQPWEAGTPASLTLGLPVRQQITVRRAVWTGRPSADPILRTVETVAVRRALRRSQTSSVGVTLVVAVALLAVAAGPGLPTGVRIGGPVLAAALVAVCLFNVRIARGARTYAGRLGVVGNTALTAWAGSGVSRATRWPSRLVRLWSPDGPEHRRWFRRALLTIVATITSASAGVALLLLSSALPSSGDDAAAVIGFLGVLLIFLGMIAELLVIATVLAWLWTFVAFRRSLRAS